MRGGDILRPTQLSGDQNPWFLTEPCSSPLSMGLEVKAAEIVAGTGRKDGRWLPAGPDSRLFSPTPPNAEQQTRHTHRWGEADGVLPAKPLPPSQLALSEASPSLGKPSNTPNS